MTRPLALTLGEPAGIGPDITLAAWRRRDELALPPFYVLADPDLLARRARTIGLDVADSASSCRRRPARSSRKHSRWSRSPKPSRPSPAVPMPPARRPRSPRSAARSPTCSPAAPHAVVTNPIAKAVLYRTGFAEPGHTEFLARLAQEHTGRSVHPVMMLWSPELAVVPVTIHLAGARRAARS